MNNDNISVLLISPFLENAQGGIAIWTKTYLENCRQFGIETMLVNTSPIGKRKKNPESKMSLLDELIRTRRILKSLHKSIKSEIDIVHLNTSCGPFGLLRDYFMSKIVKKKKKKLFIHFHCDIPFWVKNAISRYFLKKMCKNADSIFVLCKNSYNYLYKKFTLFPPLIVPNFVDFDIIKEPKIISDDIKKIIFVGGIQQQKGCNIIFNTAPFFEDIQFILIGQVSNNIKLDDLPKNVTLIGTVPHSDILDFLDNSDLFLFPSFSEGFSLSVAEAMSRGLPIIASNVGANLDMIENKGGIVVDSFLIKDYVESINAIARRDLRESMSSWCVNKVSKCYSVDSVFPIFLECYKKVLGD